jgi:hypothetical protein
VHHALRWCSGVLLYVSTLLFVVLPVLMACWTRFWHGCNPADGLSCCSSRDTFLMCRGVSSLTSYNNICFVLTIRFKKEKGFVSGSAWLLFGLQKMDRRTIMRVDL